MPQTIILNYKALVDTSITNKTAPDSITPLDEGGRLNDLADILDGWTLDFITDAGNTTTNNIFCGNLGVNTVSLGPFAMRVQGAANIIGDLSVTVGNINMTNNQEILWTGGGGMRTSAAGILDIQGVPTSSINPTANPALRFLNSAEFLPNGINLNIAAAQFRPHLYGLTGSTGILKAVDIFPFVSGNVGSTFVGQVRCLNIDAQLSGQESASLDLIGVYIGTTKGSAIVQANTNANNQFFGDVFMNKDVHAPALQEFADNAAALLGGLIVGQFYHTAGVVKVVI